MAFTGAGFSAGIVGSAGDLPGWSKLFRLIADDMAPPPREPELDALVQAASTGPELIELASWLAKTDDARFAELVRKHLRPLPMAGQPSHVRSEWERKHEAMLGMEPVGIVTMNIDELHEAALEPRGWRVICPLDAGSETALKEVILGIGTDHFVLQAHGALTEVPGRPHYGLVFTWESYRDLIERQPAYTGFMIHLFTSCNFVFVGYGLSDLDFDQFLWTDAARFGAGVREHVVVQRWPKPHDANDDERRHLLATRAILERRYGIRTLWVDEWSDVAEVLTIATITAGPSLQRMLVDAVDRNPAVRHDAHVAIGRLADTGKAVVTRVLLDAIRRETDPWRKDELIYSLGRVEPHREATRREIAAALINVALTEPRISSVAHALSTLGYYVEAGDLSALERISTRVRNERLDAGGGAAWERDDEGRLPIYAEYLVRRLRAEHEVTTPREAGVGSGVDSSTAPR